jgi:hypothetical protein
MTLGAFGATAVAGTASAEPGPAWRLKVTSVPTDVAPGDTGLLLLQVENIGDAPSVTGSPITLVDRLPQGMVATQAATLHPETVGFEPTGLWGNCAITPDERTVTCTYEPGATISPVSRSQFNELIEEGVEGSHALAPAVGIEFTVEPLALGVLTDSASVSGGGAQEEARDVATVDASSLPAGFGVANFHQWSTNVEGTPATQAGGHPYETTTSFRVNTVGQGGNARQADGVVRDLDVELPPGFIGDPNAVPKCPRSDFDKRLNGSDNPACPADTQIGTVRGVLEANFSAQIPLYNLVPPADVPAQFGAGFEKIVAFIDAGVRSRSGGGYNLVVESRDIQTDGGLQGAGVSIWGDPPDSSHDALRVPLEPTAVDTPPPGVSTPSDAPHRPFLRLPTSCGAQQTLTVSAVSWDDPLQTVVPFSGVAASTDEQNNPVSIGGCSKLDFSPSIEVGSGTVAAESPTGVSVSLKVPQNEDPNGLAEADLQNVSVTLPAGMEVSPSAANGLEACSEEQLGVSGSGSSLLFNESAARCPAGSKLGTVEVVTPLLEHPLQGALYLAKQEENPFNSLVALYLVVEGSGVLVKRAGEVHLNQQTGQIGVTFLNNPQVPLSEIKVDTFQSPHSALVNPSTCGSYTTNTDLTSWSGATREPSSAFHITEGPNGGPCPSSPLPFAPTMTGGTTNNAAGTYSPFVLHINREDGSQRLGQIQVTTPPGLLGKLAGIPECPAADVEAAEHRSQPGEGALEINSPSCPAASEVGTVTVGAGPGPEPLYVTGHEYLSGPYEGAPFSLDAITPAVAGPFDLGVVVVRQPLSVNDVTGQAMVKSDPLPTILRGIPLDIRSVTVDINHGDFIYNPSSCGPLSVTGTMTSTTGTVANTSSPFKATACSKLPFKPAFTASTPASSEQRANGAALTVKIASKQGPVYKPGEEEANIKKVDVSLPLALSARLSTLQKACTATTFETDPANCPKGSIVGTAVAHTPLLTSPLTGPAILVSHGNEAFPDLVMVLQGEGITVQLTGNTDIKKGITYSRFEAIPDAPISSFELKLPQGPLSVLAAVKPVCKPTKTVTTKKRVKVRRHGKTVTVTKKVSKTISEPLAMPTDITAQNAAVLDKTTQISVTGCPKPKSAKKKGGK